MKTKTLLFTLIMLFAGFIANAQWVRQIGAIGDDAVKDCVLDKNKNLYVTGIAHGTVDFGNGHIDTCLNNNLPRLFIAKYDENNNCLWASTMVDTTAVSGGIRIFLDTIDGSLYTEYGIGFSGLTPITGIYKINSNGTPNWTDQISPLDNLVPVFSDYKQSGSKIEFLILPYNDQGFTFINWDSSGTNYSDTNFLLPNNGSCVIHLILNKSDGSIYSSHIYSYSNTFFTDAKFNGDSIIIAGNFHGSTQIDTFSLSATMGSADYDGILASIDTSGNCNWVKQYSQGTVAEKDITAGIMVDGSKIYFFNSILAGSFYQATGFLSCYNRLTHSTISNTAGTIGFNYWFNVPGFNASKVNNDIMLISVYNVYLPDRYSINYDNGNVYAYDMNSLAPSTSINFPSGPVTSISRQSFVSDSTSLYLVGAFKGSVNFNGTSLSTTPSNTFDGYIFKKNFCNYPPITPIITKIGDSLKSSYQAGNQWYRNGIIISGANGQFYTLTQNGNYTVVVTDTNGCSSTSLPYSFISGIEQYSGSTSINIYPNPVSNELIIEFEGNTNNTGFEILNSIGQVVFKGNLLEKTVVQTTSFAPGVYLIKLENGNTFRFKKIVKE